MDKTNVVSFNKGNLYIDVNIKLDNRILPVKNETKFLGTKIDKKLNWRSHVTYIRNKISKIIGVISKIKSLLTTNAMQVLYYSLVFPYLQYCNLAWGTATKGIINPLNIIQKRIVRTMCHANPFDHTNNMFKNLKILKINDIHKHETLKFIHNELQNPVVFPFRFVGQIHNFNTRGRNNLRPPRFKSNLSKKFVTYNGCITWNKIPLAVRNTSCMTRPSDGKRGREGGGWVRERWKGGEGYYLLSSVITRCTLPSPVVTHCHPLPLVDTCYYPLSPAVTCRQPLSSVVRQVTRRRWHVLRVVLGASCFPGFLPPLLGGVDGTSCVLSWRLPAFRASCLPCLAESKPDRRAYIVQLVVPEL